MELARPESSTRNYYDRFDDRRQLLRAVLFGLPVLILVLWFVLEPDHWINYTPLSIAGALILLAAAFRLPYAARNLLLAYRGAPALSIDDLGLWSRPLSELGWIKWSDIADVVTQVSERARGSGDLQRDLGIHLHNEAHARLPWNYRVSQIAAMLMCFVMGYREDPRTLWLISSRQLTGSWDELMAALDPMLAANGIPKREEKIQSLFSRWRRQ
jgi:hypothetical protein